MTYCSNCGLRLDEGMNYCPSCGTAARAARPPAFHQAGAEAQEQTILAAMAYLLFLIPLLAAPKEQRFVRYHTNQGFVLFLCYMACALVVGLAQTVLFLASMYPGAHHAAVPGLSLLLRGGVLSGVFLGLVSLTYLILCIVGVVNAVNGRMKPLPLIGRITLIK